MKGVAESLPVVPKISVEVVEVYEVTMVSVKDSVPMDQISMKMGEMFGEILGVLQSNDVEVRSNPLCVYHTWDQENGVTVMEAGIPILKATEINVEGRVETSSIPAGNAAKAIHMGSYSNLDRTHYAIDEWAQENGIEFIGPPWEVYITDPGTEPDTANWITEVYYPVE